MKKDRNCGNYPVYPQMVPYFGDMGAFEMAPQAGMMSYPNYGMINPGSFQNVYGQTENSITNKLNSLEQRVNRLEKIVNNGNYSNNYNSSNYQMM